MGIAHTHPFWDGNGRVARLVANIPLLNVGLPPIVIASEDRKEYIETLAKYQSEVGKISPENGVCPQALKLTHFAEFCTQSYKITQQLVEQAKKQQSLRS